jgi:hypothetical protein
LIEKCKLNGVTVVFALNRRQLGHAVGAKRPTVVVGIQGMCAIAGVGAVVPRGRYYVLRLRALSFNPAAICVLQGQEHVDFGVSACTRTYCIGRQAVMLIAACCGTLDYSGANETYAKLLALANDGRVQYQTAMASHAAGCGGDCVGEESMTKLVYASVWLPRCGSA